MRALAHRELVPAYLPHTLLEHWRQHPAQPPVWAEWLNGSLMHCDISGFTGMSESLAQLGKEGGELMAGVLNQFFERMLGIADGYGGEQMKFGGDAMLLFFSGEQHLPRAAACGLAMQTAMREFRRVTAGGQEHGLRMRAGIHAGRFFSASVGNPDTLHYLLAGTDVNRTAAIEAAARPGQVAATQEAASLLCNGRATRSPEGVFTIRSVEEPASELREASRKPLPLHVLGRYLMPPLREGRMPGIQGEHRRVTSLFIHLLGTSELLEKRPHTEVLRRIDAYVNILLSALERHGGFLAGSDIASDGDKLIALFGAPVLNERQEESALRCALAIDQDVQSSGLKLRHRMGINSGQVFAGEIGSHQRREYTVIGDSVNLAARLMAAAHPGEILVSALASERAGPAFELARMRPIRVKGKTAPVRLHRLRGVRDEQHTPESAYTVPMYGRDEEMKGLLRLATATEKGTAKWAFVWGEPGIGKSRLVAALAAQLQEIGWRDIRLSSYAYASSVPFGIWRGLLRDLLGIDVAGDPRSQWESAQSAITRFAPQHAAFAPLIAEILSLPAPEAESSMASIEPGLRRRHLAAMLAQIISRSNQRCPVLLAAEDVHWADAPSLELLGELVRSQHDQIMVCVTSRSGQPPEPLGDVEPDLSLHLTDLPPEAARQLLSSIGELAGHLVEAVLDRGHGNPLFLHEISRADAPRGSELPETVNDIIMARLDRLVPDEKSVLTVASVIGPSFDLEILEALVGDHLPSRRVRQALAGLTREELTRPLARDLHAFAHVLTQEVAYETVPYRQRRILHRRIIDIFERRHADRLESVCELLLHHSERAADYGRAVLFGAMSGDRAMAVFANSEALRYYGRALEQLGAARRVSGADRSLLLERIGDCLERIGRHREAVETLSQSLDAWRRSRRRRPLLVPWSAERGREAVISRKIGVSCERSADYDASLRWLDEAMALAPKRPSHIRAEICAALSVSLFRKGMYGDAVRWGRSALGMARRSGDRRQLAYAHNMLAASYMEQGALRRAIRHRRKAVQLYHELRDYPGQAAANNNLGACYQLLGILDGALYHYEVALGADERSGDAVDAAVVHNNIGEVLLALGRVNEAITHLDEVISEQLHNPDLTDVAGLAEVNLSRCQMSLGDLRAAASHLRRGLRLLQQVGAEGILTEARLQRAELFLAQGRFEAARRIAGKALAQARTLDARLYEARAHRLIGEALGLLGRRNAARQQLRAAITLARAIGAEYEEACGYLAVARIALHAGGSRAEARRALTRATAMASRMGASLLMSACRQEEEVLA